MYESERPQREIPDFALDVHTAKGRRAQRGVDHFFKVGAAIKNAERSLLPDGYLKRAWHARRTASNGHEETDLDE
jgi:hypothetical protein